MLLEAYTRTPLSQHFCTIVPKARHAIASNRKRVQTQLCDLQKSHTHLRQPLATSGKFRRNWQTAPNAPKMCNLTWDDHRNPLRPKIQLGGAPRSCARTCQRLPEVAGAGARGRQSSNAFKAKVFAQSLRKACLAKIPIQA